MFKSKTFIFVLVLCCIECNYGLKKCNDCVNFQLCPAAVELAINHRDEVTQSKFETSFCGYNYLKSQRMVKVCCSDFTDPVAYGEPSNRATKAAIETHPNVHLLPKSCGDVDGKKIIGGTIAKLYEFPWMALISCKTNSGRQFLCSGTVISSKYILTAAHCVKNNYTVAGVRIGEFDLRYKTDCQGEEPHLVCESHIQDIRVENVIPHQNYLGRLAPANDIALIRLLTPIDFKYKNALPICLPVTQELRNVPLPGTIGTVAGWGLADGRVYPEVLLKTKISIKTDNECKSLIYKNEPTGGIERVLGEICAGDDQKDSCNGDSGGPLMVQGLYEGVDRYIQYGIVSRGSSNCGSEPGIYTDVTKYMEWILDNIKE